MLHLAHSRIDGRRGKVSHPIDATDSPWSRKMICRVLAIGGIGLLVGALDARAFEYNGLCEASAGVFVDAKHFVVASDETNRLQLYERGKADPIGSGIDMEAFTSFDKSDLEAAAAI